MAEIHSPETVARVFAEQFYTVLSLKSDESYRFYEDSSVVTWDVELCTTTVKGIHNMIMSSDFKDSLVKIEDIHAQDSVEQSILVVVSGSSTGKDDLKRKFNQTFLLAKKENGFFVKNDILRFVDAHDEKVPKPPLVADSVPAKVSLDVCTQEESAGDKVTSEVAAELTTGDRVTSEVGLEQTVSEVVSEVKEAAQKTSYLEMLSKGKTSSAPAPATWFVRVSASDGLPVEEKQQTPRNGLRRAVALAPVANNTTTKTEIPPPSNGALENTHTAKGIYVGGLPPDTTVNDLTDAVKAFGRIKKFDAVQVILSEDQYCFGFVHFQSADSAKKAVEAQTITVRGKKAYISHKRSSRRAADGHDSRGRSPSGRGESLSKAPSGRGESHSRAPSSNGHSGNVETHQNVVNQNGSNNGSSSSDGHNGNDGEANQNEGEANQWIDVRRDRRGRNRNAYQRNDQRFNGGEAYQRNGVRRDRRNYQRRNNNGDVAHDHRNSTVALVKS